MTRQPLELSIGELVLHGFDARDRHAISDTVQRELGALLTEHGLPAMRRESATLSVDAGRVELAHDATPACIGAELARALHRGLGGVRGTEARQ
jgi:hypothetical protein